MSSHRNTPSFSRLRDVLQPLPGAAESESLAESSVSMDSPPANSALQTPIQERTCGSESAAFVPLSATSVASFSRSVLPAKPGKRKVLAKTATFRLPMELLEALRSVAEYNNLNQGDIVLEALCLHLQNFTWPPEAESEKLRETLRHLL